MSQCELSVIIPIYNGARFLKDTLESVLKQTFKNYELILVDDGSTDSTPKICDEYAKKDKRIKVCHQENKGMSKARDTGYQMAVPHSSIAFLDADDIIAPDMFEHMMKYKEYNIVQVCSKNINSNKTLDYVMDQGKPGAEYMSGEDLLHRYFYSDKNKGDIGYLWGMLINRDFYRSMEQIIREAETILPQNYLNDVYCVPRFMLEAQNVVLLNRVYILHRISRYTDSRTVKPNDLHYELMLANKMNLDFYKQHGCFFAYDKQVVGFYLVILKIWYQAVTSETDLKKRNKYMKLVQKNYRRYYSELNKVKCNSIKEYAVKLTILLWGLNKSLWRISVGNIKYGLMYRLQV